MTLSRLAQARAGVERFICALIRVHLLPPEANCTNSSVHIRPYIQNVLPEIHTYSVLSIFFSYFWKCTVPGPWRRGGSWTCGSRRCRGEGQTSRVPTPSSGRSQQSAFDKMTLSVGVYTVQDLSSVSELFCPGGNYFRSQVGMKRSDTCSLMFFSCVLPR